MLWNAVAVALGYGVFTVEGLALGGCPGKVVTADLDVVVCEFAKLVIVHSKKFSLLRCAQLETGNLVDGEGEEGADSKGVGSAGADVSNLLVDCGTLASDRTSRKSIVDTVETDDVVGAENTVEKETHHSSDTVLSEHIEGIVDLDPELD